jgi:hypothetical protein
MLDAAQPYKVYVLHNGVETQYLLTDLAPADKAKAQSIIDSSLLRVKKIVLKK